MRNLLRGYRLGIPTGQAAADAFGVPALTPAQLRGEAGATGPIPIDDRNQLLGDALADGGFLDATPLWFYVLREAELQEDGNRLGQVGSRIVCETLIGQLRADGRGAGRGRWRDPHDRRPDPVRRAACLTDAGLTKRRPTERAGAQPLARSTCCSPNSLASSERDRIPSLR